MRQTATDGQDRQRKRMMWQLPFLVLLIVGTVLIVRGQRDSPYQHDSGFVFGTLYNVTYRCDTNMQHRIETELGVVDHALSMFNDSSVISAVNRGERIEVNDMFRTVFELSMTVSRETDGAFDITVAPLVNAWGFGFEDGYSPTKRQVDSLLRLVGYEKVSYCQEGDSAEVRMAVRGMQLDCSSVAKGYGCDIVAALFHNCGINDFMVEIGGEIVASGVSEKRVPWRVGVEKPVDDTISTHGNVGAVINITDKAIATSGNYRNYYYKDGKKYAHTIDPHTGYPVQHNILSATVIADDCATADAYATAFMVLGLDSARAVLDKHPELMAYFIYADDTGGEAVWCSPALEDKIER